MGVYLEKVEINNILSKKSGQLGDEGSCCLLDFHLIDKTKLFTLLHSTAVLEKANLLSSPLHSFLIDILLKSIFITFL